MNKQERQAKNEITLNELIDNTKAINELTLQAEQVVREYWLILKDLWTRKIGYNEAGRIKDFLASYNLRGFKEYRKLLKTK